jgi:hypothetical protein
MKSKSFFERTKHTGSLPLIIQEIVRVSDPEKILLLSASYNFQLTENIFQKNPVQEFSNSHYDLLVLSGNSEKKSMAEREIMLISKLINFPDLQIHLMDIKEFNKGVESGDEFENYILLNAILSYYKGQIPFADPKQTKSTKPNT